MATGFRYSAHICGLFEVKKGVPVFKHWGIFSSGPTGLTTMSRDHIYLEHFVCYSDESYADALDAAQRYVAAEPARWGEAWCAELWREIANRDLRKKS